jgi:hypothetical protein
MNPAELPLRDIHTPAPVGWWPPAPGWWLIAVLLILGVLAAYWYRRRPQARLRRRIHAELALLRRQWAEGRDHREFLQGLSALLRRSAIALDGRAASAGLSGERWQAFLNRSLPDRPFSSHPGILLMDAAYRPAPPALSDDDVEQLTRLCARWLDEAQHGEETQFRDEAQPA